MDLLTPLVDEKYFHPNFKNILTDSEGRNLHRDVLLAWARDMPYRDGREKFIKEFQTTFNSSFWEMYIHQVFLAYGARGVGDCSYPDFVLDVSGVKFSVEAVTANAGVNEEKEWNAPNMSLDNPFTSPDLNAFNKRAIIRYFTALESKSRKYGDYLKNPHVDKNPFVIAVGSYSSPEFTAQFDRPMMALLYDYYVDEEAFIRNPKNFPEGPPAIQLRGVEKENGTLLELGVFNSEKYSHISAIIFSCTASWGKLAALSGDPKTVCITTWSDHSGAPKPRVYTADKSPETITDGLQIFHNPYAKYPLNKDILTRGGVTQTWANLDSGSLVTEGYANALQFRKTLTLNGGGKFIEEYVQGLSKYLSKINRSTSS